MAALAMLMVVSMAVAFAATPWVRALAIRVGVVDRPDQQRKLHIGEIPRAGGLVLVMAYVTSVALLMMLPSASGDTIRAHLGTALALAPATAVVFAVGFLDDLVGQSPWFRLCFETVGALMACAAGVTIGEAWWSWPVTVVWLVGAANAFNLIDGVDGLAAGVGLFATLTILAAALATGNQGLALATAPLAGALVGFLRYNFEPASIYLGDSGSLTIGFLLGCFGVIWGYKSATAIGMTAPLILLSLPLLDIGLAVIRRFLAMKPIFGADRGHIHHRLLARGLRPRHVALVAYLACGVAAAASLAHSSVPPEFTLVVVGLFGLLVWLAIGKLGLTEFRVARRTLLSGRVRHWLRQEIMVDDARERMVSARTAEECWDHLCATARELGLSTVMLRLGDRAWRAQVGSGAGPRWETKLDLDHDDWVAFAGHSDDPAAARALLPLAQAVREALKPAPVPVPAALPAREPTASPDRSGETTTHSPTA